MVPVDDAAVTAPRLERMDAAGSCTAPTSKSVRRRHPAARGPLLELLRPAVPAPHSSPSRAHRKEPGRAGSRPPAHRARRGQPCAHRMGTSAGAGRPTGRDRVPMGVSARPPRRSPGASRRSRRSGEAVARADEPVERVTTVEVAPHGYPGRCIEPSGWCVMCHLVAGRRERPLAVSAPVTPVLGAGVGDDAVLVHGRGLRQGLGTKT